MAKRSTTLPFKRPTRPTTPCKLFTPYENGRIRNFRFNVNSLADFEQEAGMGFAMLMKQRAMFATARAMLWAGLKHEDRGLTIEAIGELMSDYLMDESVPEGEHNIDELLSAAIVAARDQGALGRIKEEEIQMEEPNQIEGATTGPNDQAGQETAIEAEVLDPTN